MAEPFLGQIMMFGGNFSPRGWAFCDGQLLAISQNTALFSLLGTIYGGDGRTTFALPDLRGRVPVGPGQGPGLTDWRVGSRGGTEMTTLTTANMPSHSHSLSGEVKVKCADEKADTHVGKGNPLAKNALNVDKQNDTIEIYKDKTSATYEDGNLLGGMENTLAVANAGGNQPFYNLQPFLAIHYIIALEGIYPSRN